MLAHLSFSCRGILVCLALLFGNVDSARANFFEDIGDFFSGNAPEVASSNACNSYAFGAVNVAEAARTNNCPLTGPRYGTDEKGHYFWCMSVTPETSRAEANARNAEFAACVSRSTQGYCGSYGEIAAKHARENKIYHCGFTGPRWGEGSEGHRAYCISEKIAQKLRDEISNWPGAELTARADAVDQCKAKYSEKKKQFCNLYATEAVESANKFKEMKCIGSQKELVRGWYLDYDTHFSWCIGLSKGVGRTASKASIERVNAETQKHRDALNACITRNELITRGKESPTNKLYSGPNSRSLEEFSKVAPPSSAPAKPNPASNAKPGTGGIYLSKPGGGNSAMDRLSGGGSSGATPARSDPSQFGGKGGGINTSKQMAPPSGGGGGGINTSKPIVPPSGGGGGINTTKPNAPSSGGGIYLSKPR